MQKKEDLLVAERAVGDPFFSALKQEIALISKWHPFSCLFSQIFSFMHLQFMLFSRLSTVKNLRLKVQDIKQGK